MVRTHSSHTASPTRFQSPQRSPARRPSQDGSQYEMDLDALGLNSTFESTELDNSHRPPVDHLETSEIEGPEDFTMNMTYWMTADLPLAQIKSRKEANTKRPVIRMDVMQEDSEGQGARDATDKPTQERIEQRRDDRSRTASPTRRANGNTGERVYSKPPSERSMENEEKVRSFLSNLPDTEMDGAITGTPLHVPRHSFLQVPRSSPPKARSLQPTVEDYDTPRKPTAETVIRHTSAVIDTSEQDAARNKIMELQSQLEQQESRSRSRITELETLLSYTRSDLENARTDNYRQKERVSSLEKSMAQQTADHEASRTTTDTELKARESALETKMHEFGEKMRLENLAKLETMVEEFERQRKALEESKRQLTDEVKLKAQSLEEAQTELATMRRLREQELQENKTQVQQPENKDDPETDRLMLAEQLSSVQARAEALQSSLESATSEARAAREDAQNKDTMRSAAETEARSHAKRITELEAHLSTARFEVQCAEADMAAKKQLFQTNLDLSSRLRVLQSELETAQRSSTVKEQEGSRTAELEARIKELESEIASLRSSPTNTSTSDSEQSRNIADLERNIRSLQSQLQSAQDDLAAKDQQISQYMETQEHNEQRLNTSLGRIQSLEAGMTSLRQQLAEAHRDVAKARADAERFKQDLEDANDRLQDARAEADRRVTDLDRKLAKLKELKADTETKFKELRAQHEDLREGHEAMIQDVRDKAEDAVRKAASLLDQERSEKKRLQKELKKTKQDLDNLRARGMSSSDDESSTIAAPEESHSKSSADVSSLRTALAAQTAQTASLKSSLSALRHELRSFHNQPPLSSHVAHLQKQNADLQAQLLHQKAEHDALDAAMDEKLAGLLSGLVKEKARSVVGVRDGQWEERVKGLVGERELLGRVVMRQWGREEMGVSEEGEGTGAARGKQKYGYKFVKREK
ncbi:hypothetical protein PTNB73_06396 [Pyrenophora teres f. teres]|nr:hypothetical protein HRS9122_09452 [Pyrenophora teres f. teres]KAE8863189.1 hypothetical protein PTNB73_06396 [Pyrenophora teres f. teres]